MNQPTYSMWGKVERVTEIAPGIWRVSTIGHGGFVISEDRAAEIKRRFPEFSSQFSTTTEFEEDCDGNLIVAAFHEYFADEQVALAVWQIKRMAYKEPLWNHVDEVLIAEAYPTGPIDRTDQWFREHAKDYRIGGGGSGPSGSWTLLSRISDGQRLMVEGFHYGNILTAEQVSGMKVLQRDGKTVAT